MQQQQQQQHNKTLLHLRVRKGEEFAMLSHSTNDMSWT